MVTCRKLCSGIAETVFPSFSYEPSLLALGERKGFDEKTKKIIREVSLISHNVCFTQRLYLPGEESVSGKCTHYPAFL